MTLTPPTPPAPLLAPAPATANRPTDGGAQPPAWHTTGIAIAAHSRRAACLLVNVALIAVVAGAAWWLGWVWAVLAGVGVVVFEVAGMVRTGRSPGHQVVGLRVVDKTTGLPPSLGAFLARRCVRTDLRKGRDPLRLIPRPLPGPVLPPVPAPPPAPARVGTFALVADDGSRFVIRVPTLVGRRASDPSDRYATVTIPDVSRTLSRNHALLEPTPAGLRVTDVGSGNGTGTAGADGLHRFTKYQPVTVAAGTRLLLGTRFFEVTYE